MTQNNNNKDDKQIDNNVENVENKTSENNETVTHVNPMVDPENKQLSKYPNVPDDVISDLKEKYGVILGLYFGDKPILYRLFNVVEYQKYQDDYMKLADQIQKEESQKPTDNQISNEQLQTKIAEEGDNLLVEYFTIYPDNIMNRISKGEYPGGCIYRLCQSILVNNGFTDIEPLTLRKEEIEQNSEVPGLLDQQVFADIDDLTADKVINEMVNPNGEISLIWFLDQLYIVRGISYNEYSEVKKMSNTLDPINMSVELVKRFTLYPYPIDMDSVPAGIITKCLSDNILALSGFGTTTPDIVIMD